MSRRSLYAALAVVTTIVLASVASAQTNHRNTSAFAGAHNGTSDMDTRKQCYAMARERWPSTNQDMQTNRDFAYRTCAFDHGVRNP
jgi:hypothetical protein